MLISLVYTNIHLNVYNRRWVIKNLAQHLQDMPELIDKESLLVKDMAEVIAHKYLLVQNFDVHSSQLMTFHLQLVAKSLIRD